MVEGAAGRWVLVLGDTAIVDHLQDYRREAKDKLTRSSRQAMFS